MEVSLIDFDRVFRPVISNANSLGDVCISASESKELMGSSSISNLPMVLAIRRPFEVPKLTASVCEGRSVESAVVNHRLISLAQKYSGNSGANPSSTKYSSFTAFKASQDSLYGNPIYWVICRQFPLIVLARIEAIQ